MVFEIVRAWPQRVPIQVLCSGNLTIERTLAPLKRRVSGNDVTLYTCALGAAAAGLHLPVRVRDEHVERFGWLNESLTDDLHETAATVVLASRFAPAHRHPGHAYWDRQVEGFRQQWSDLHAGTTERLRRGLPKLEAFHVCGALELLDGLDDDAAVISFPPFTTAWGYENIFKQLHALFDWPAPRYRVFDDEGIEELLDRVSSRRHWIVAVPYRVERLAEHCRGLAHTTNRGVPLYIYASRGGCRVVMPRQKIEPLPAVRLGPEEELRGPLAIREITAGQFNLLRSEYLNPGIPPATPSAAWAVLCGGKLIGAFAVSLHQGPWHGTFEERIGSFVYLLSDFPVRPTRYRRLAKLILYAALSREVQVLLEQRAQRRVRSLLTTAFTSRPASMKYRGLFQLLTRKATDEGYTLNYWAPAGQWTLKEGLELWTRKHGSCRHASSASIRASSSCSSSTPAT